MTVKEYTLFFTRVRCIIADFIKKKEEEVTSLVSVCSGLENEEKKWLTEYNKVDSLYKE